MKAARRQIIAELIQSQPFISLKELEERFPDVTGMTLRRDIEYFEKQGELIKVRGGARSMKFINSTSDDGYAEREKENYSSKLAIASKALEFIEKGKSYFFDSGTTVMRLAEMIPDEHMNITTPGPNIALELAKKQHPIINLVGGIVNRESISVTGSMAIDFLSDINIDIAFIGPSGYSQNNGFSCGNYAESELKNFIVKKAKTVIMLMDTSKLDKNLPYTFCRLADIDILITDKPIPVAFLDTTAYPELRVVVCAEKEKSTRDMTTRLLTREELELLRSIQDE
ncbi:MAG: DeoR/GlpR transcriptional regulator [Clostridia bacterium]|nr:DeoR/GlpR transcriptional regulator [Clostridia bacterium]